jgi:N-methylhydantoinase A
VTVTDANLILGRLRPEAFLGGHMSLDVAAAEQAMDRLAEQLGTTREQAAEGVIRVANEHMARALRVMSVQRGIDPRGLTLTSFGGAGGLHVCALAEALGMTQALVPIHSGVLSALGMLVAPRMRQLSRTVNRIIDDLSPEQAEVFFNEMLQQGQAELLAEGVSADALRASYSADLRYHGQSFTLNIPWDTTEVMVEQFHHLHEQRFGHALAFAVEVVNLRVQLSSQRQAITILAAREMAAGEGQRVHCFGVDQPVVLISRDQLVVEERVEGPLLVIDAVSTTFVAPGWCCVKDRCGNLLLCRSEHSCSDMVIHADIGHHE